MAIDTQVAYSRLLSLLEVIVSCITRHTPKPQIEHFPDDYRITLRVDGRDQGRCVGKKGLTIWALQTLFWYAGYTQSLGPYSIKLFEPERSQGVTAPPVKVTTKWDREKIKIMLATIKEICLPCHSSFILDETDETTATVTFRVEKYLQTSMSDPDFAEAVSVLVRAAGMAQGASLKTEVLFE